MNNDNADSGQDIIAIKKQRLLERYTSAPKHIKLISRTETEDENGMIWHLGASPMLIRLDAKKINGSHNQAVLNQAFCNAAKAVNLSTNFVYPKPQMGAKAITGSLTRYFTRKDDFCFVLEESVRPSEAMRSLLAPVVEKTDH